MAKNNVIAIGCFYSVEIPNTENYTNNNTEVDDESEESKQEPTMIEQLVLIGCVYSKVETENARNESIIARADEPRWNRQSWFDRTREFFACGNLILS